MLKNMKRLTKHISFLLLFSPLLANANEWEIANIKNEEWVYEKDPSIRMITRSHYTFTNGVKLSTNLSDFKLISVIKTKIGKELFFFEGRVCNACDANTSLYVAPVNVRVFDRDNPRYSYPGKLFYYMDGTLIEESQVFYGGCLSKGSPVVLWYTKYKDTNGKWHEVTSQLEFNGGNISFSKNKINYRYLNKTLQFVKSGVCKELVGVDRTSEP